MSFTATNKDHLFDRDKDPTVGAPEYYGGADNPYEAIKVIEAWELGFSLGNTIKYISRAGKKDPTKEIHDLKKALWYLKRRIYKLENTVETTCTLI